MVAEHAVRQQVAARIWYVKGIACSHEPVSLANHGQICLSSACRTIL